MGQPRNTCGGAGLGGGLDRDAPRPQFRMTPSLSGTPGRPGMNASLLVEV